MMKLTGNAGGTLKAKKTPGKVLGVKRHGAPGGVKVKPAAPVAGRGRMGIGPGPTKSQLR